MNRDASCCTTNVNDVDADAASDDSYSPSSFADETRISVDDNDNTFISNKRDTELTFVNGKRAVGFVVRNYNDMDRKGDHNNTPADEATLSGYDQSSTLKEGGDDFQGEGRALDVEVDERDDEAIDMTVASSDSQGRVVSISVI